MSPSPTATPIRRRPRDRKAQIASTAARLFCDLGYHRVSVGDIAAAVDITARAIYRHFANKRDLLVAVVVDAFDALDACFDADDPIEALAATAVERRHLGLLIERESLHVTGEEHHDVELRRRRLAAKLQELVSERRPDLPPDDAALVAWWALAVACSPSSHTATTPHPEAVLTDLLERAVATPALPRHATGPAVGPQSPWAAGARSSRRELVLAAAIDLFAARGFADVRMEDIGAAAGIAGPSIYQHFAGKTEILVAALTRGGEWLQLGIATALSAARPAEESLALVVRSYVDFFRGQTELMSVLLSETIYLPDDERHAIRRVQHDYVAEWIRLLIEVRPDMTSGEARFRVHGALGLINDTIRRGRGGERPDLADLLQEAGFELLGVDR